MARESGSVNPFLEAQIQIRQRNGETIDCLIDTGFSGALVLPNAIVHKHNLTIVGRERFRLVGTQTLTADIALVDINWLGKTQTVRAIVSDGTESLVGTELLSGSRLVIDYKTTEVEITNQATSQ